MPYWPCVLVGLGGTGTQVVERVRQRVLAATRYEPGLQGRLVDGLFQFLAVDTTKSILDRRAMPQENYHVLSVPDPSTLIEELWDKDPFFRTWWYAPPNWPRMYSPRPITQGAGVVPLNGRLAYQADLLRPLDTFQQKLDAALGKARDVWEADAQEGLILVYLVGSLCGGTGSGLFLSVAHHVRAYLGGEATIIAAMATASVFNLAAHGADHVGANCCAALNSLDLWLGPDGADREQYMPFYASRNGRVEGRAAPIDVSYLITRGNRKDRAVSDDVTDYLRLMADGVFSEIMGPASNMAAERFVAWVAAMKDVPLHQDRPVHYGSFGVSVMRYDVDRITEYLAMRFCRMVLDAWFLSPSDASRKTSQLARDFVASHWLDEVLIWLVRDEYETWLPLPLDIRDLVMQAQPGEVVSVIERCEEALRKQLGLEPKGSEEHYLTLAELMRINADELYERTVQLLDKQVADLLRGSEDGFEAARNFLVDLRAEIEAYRVEIQLECESDKARQIVGYEDDTKGLWLKREEWLTAILEARGIRRRRKIRDFVKEWWEPWENAMRQLVIRRKAVEFYSQVLGYLDVLSDGFGRMGKILTELRDEFLMQYPTMLGQRRGRGTYVPEQAILDSAHAVDRKFLDWRALPERCRGDSLFAREGGVIAYLEFLWELLKTERRQEAGEHEMRIRDELRESILARGRREFRGEVNALSLWDALELEAEYAGYTAPAATKKYVEDKIRECAGRYRPAWCLDEERATAEQLNCHYNGELMFNEEAWTAFEERQGAIDLWSLIEDAARCRLSQVPTPDPHCLMIRVVEGRAPLYLVRESGELVDAYYRFRDKSPDVPLYVDVRYENLLMRLLKPEREEGRLILLLAEFLGSQYPETELGRELQTPIQAEEPGRGAYRWKGRTFARSRLEAYDKMRPYEEVYQQLAAAARDVWSEKITPPDERATFEAMAAWFDRRARQRGSKLLEADVKDILERVDRGQAHPG